MSLCITTILCGAVKPGDTVAVVRKEGGDTIEFEPVRSKSDPDEAGVQG